MLKIIITLFFSSLLINLLEGTFFLHLDNQTKASYDDVLDDPFLVIRSKIGDPQDSMEWKISWKKWAEIKHQEDIYSEVIASSIPSFEEKEKGLLEVFGQACFDHVKPTFYIKFFGKDHPHFLWWQISSDLDFKNICSNLNVQIPYTNKIELTDLEETFLNPDQTYYCRVCTNHTEWSSAFAFQVKKPAQVNSICFSKLDDQLYELSWPPSSNSTTTYFIFASNALDFVPSLYLDEQLDEIDHKQVLIKTLSSNFLYETHQPSILIKGDYAYYRIIAYDKGQFAIPSSLIYIYDYTLKPCRTHLKQDPENPLLFKRTLFPSDNLEEHTSSLLWLESLVNYFPSPLVPQTIWEKLKPYFLPLNHPIKARLDRLFQKQRVTQSAETFEKGGFNKPKKRKPTQIIIGKHPQFKEYIFKVYLDTQPPLCDWDNWLKRIEGANSIRSCLKRHGFHHFKVPHKWIYPLPHEPSPPSDSRYHRKNFILITENMFILDSDKNLKAFKNEMTPQLLEELYTILTEEGLIDSVYPDNIPFTKNGQIAFIDTEHHHLSPIPYYKLAQFLSSDLQKYWLSLSK